MDATLTLAAVVTADFEGFYLAEFPKVYRACLSFTRDPERARDATQESFARAFARWKRLSRQTWAGGWAMTTAINLCKETRRSESAAPLGTQAAPTGERLDLLAALRTLPERQRVAAVLFYIGDHPVTEVAEVMSISEGAVKSHLSRARESLREKLERS